MLPENILDKLLALDKHFDLDKLLPALADLLDDAGQAAKDGRFTLTEGLRLGAGIIRLVREAVRKPA